MSSDRNSRRAAYANCGRATHGKRRNCINNVIDAAQVAFNEFARQTPLVDDAHRSATLDKLHRAHA
jgi:hypothetical protein